jgi:hypothetical protein
VPGNVYSLDWILEGFITVSYNASDYFIPKRIPIFPIPSSYNLDTMVIHTLGTPPGGCSAPIYKTCQSAQTVSQLPLFPIIWELGQ